ncbi:MAG TPA: DUF4815 domain-containing protein, partial [Thermomicrobiaceae bacterium]|nr:DUF4815 domain-containing protein [Thermomicrobiaceae bacterium]
MSRVSWRIAAGVAVLSLVVAALVGVAGVAAAPITDQSVMSSLYFPWIPNGETLDGAGPWYGAVSLQNLESVPVDVAFNSTTNTVTIPARGTVSLSAGTLGIAAPGGQLVATASWDASSLPTAVCTPAGTTTQTVSTTQTVTHTTQNGADTITLPSNETFKDVTSVTYGSTTYVLNKDYKVVTINGQVFNVDWSLGGSQPPTNATYSVN